MELTDDLVRQVAHLARLSFEEAELQRIKSDMARITSFMEKLNELDTNGVEPLIYMTDEVNVLRDDAAQNTLTKAEALKNAPVHDSDYFKVPKVLKGAPTE